jgi:acyl carrier protein
VLNDAEFNSRKSEYLYLMAESDFNKLKEFIVQQAGVDENEITPDTRLYEDLGIYGDDAFELLIEYGKKFNVDVSKFMAADYFEGEGGKGLIDVIYSVIKFFTGSIPSTKLNVLRVNDLENGIKAGKLNESVIQAGKKKEGICQVEMGYFQIEDSVIPGDQIVSMYAMHILLNRDLSDHLPEKKYYERYKKLLSNIPGTPMRDIRAQLNHSVLQFYCRCGCHSFFVFTDSKRQFNELISDNGVFGEVTFETNYEEELNVTLFSDRNGLLKQVKVYFGENNLKPIPDDIKIGKVIGLWGNMKKSNRIK